jgi:hypothetical protein
MRGHLLGEAALDRIGRFQTRWTILGMDGIWVDGGSRRGHPPVWV